MARHRRSVTVANEKLRQLRLANDWSQLELSCRSGITQATISRLETGRLVRVHLRTAHRLARALGANVELLLPDSRPSRS